MNNLISSGNSIMGFYVTYERMQQIMKVFENTRFADSEHIDVYIDLSSVTKELFLYKMPLHGYNEIATSIINMVAHYRHYFATRHKVQSKFYLIESSNIPYMALEKYPDYNRTNIKLRTQRPDMLQAVSEAYELLNMLIKYIPDVFFIYEYDEAEKKAETSVKIAQFMSHAEEVEYRTNNNVPVIIISKDPQMNLIFTNFSDVFILRPRKKGGMDISSFITASNVVENVFGAAAFSKHPEYRDIFTRNDILGYHVLRGLESRNIKPVLNNAETRKFLYDAHMEFSYKTISELIEPLGEAAALNLSLLNFDAQLRGFSTALALGGDHYKIHKIQLLDGATIKRYNETELYNCPIMLDKL